MASSLCWFGLSDRLKSTLLSKFFIGISINRPKIVKKPKGGSILTYNDQPTSSPTCDGISNGCTKGKLPPKDGKKNSTVTNDADGENGSTTSSGADGTQEVMYATREHPQGLVSVSMFVRLGDEPWREFYTTAKQFADQGR